MQAQAWVLCCTGRGGWLTLLLSLSLSHTHFHLSSASLLLFPTLPPSLPLPHSYHMPSSAPNRPGLSGSPLHIQSPLHPNTQQKLIRFVALQVQILGSLCPSWVEARSQKVPHIFVVMDPRDMGAVAQRMHYHVGKLSQADGNMRTLSDMGGHSGVRIMRLGLVPLNHLLSDRISGKEIVGPGVFWGLRGDFSLQPSLRTTAQRNEGVMSTLAAAFLQNKPHATHLFQAAGTTCWSYVGSGSPAAQTRTGRW